MLNEYQFSGNITRRCNTNTLHTIRKDPKNMNTDKNYGVRCRRSLLRVSEGTPVLLAYPHGDKQVKVFCPYCKKWHYHGRSDGNYEGFRKSHCPIVARKSEEAGRIQSPLSSYYIMPAEKAKRDSFT